MEEVTEVESETDLLEKITDVQRLVIDGCLNDRPTHREQLSDYYARHKL